MRTSRRTWFLAPALLVIAAAATFAAPAQGLSSAPSAFGCITAFGTQINPVCPSGAPSISNASITGGPGVITSNTGVTTTGSVYRGGQQVGGLNGLQLNAPIVGVIADLGDSSYWLVALDGGVFALGGAPFYGSMEGQHLNEPIVGISGGGSGYWLVASDGGVFSFGDAPFYGSLGGQHLNNPIVGMEPTFDGHGYWLVASDGGVFAFGSTGFFGSMGGKTLNASIVAMQPTFDGQGYWLVASDGGIFAFGDAPFLGSDVGLGYPVITIGIIYPLGFPPVGASSSPPGYCVALTSGSTYCNTS